MDRSKELLSHKFLVGASERSERAPPVPTPRKSPGWINGSAWTKTGTLSAPDGE
jgi:hypothetical protein